MTDPNQTKAGAAVEGVAEEMFRYGLAESPFASSQLGFTEYIGALPDLTDAGRDRRAGQLAGIEERARAVGVDDLDDEGRITRAMVLRAVSDARLDMDARAEDYTVSPTIYSGPAARVLLTFAKTILLTAADAEAYRARCAKLGEYVDGYVERLRLGAADNLVPVRRLTARAIDQLDAYLATPLADDPLLSVPDPADGVVNGWRERLADTVRDEARPAMSAFRDFLAEAVLPTSRDDNHPGLAHLPLESDLYQRLADHHTTAGREVAAIHRTGLELVERLTEEMRELGARTLGTSDFAEIVGRLRSDPDLYFTTSEEVEDAARTALDRANAALPAWLSVLPHTECVVRPMPPLEVEDAVMGQYQLPSEDGSRPGTYWINTYKPTARARFEAEALAFHESVPGHHIQLAVCGELTDQSDFRRYARVTAYTEGWALYTERLADEMGLYTSEVCRLGMISFDFWRACRLVVDTGMHAFGWSRDRAVTYMLDHSALTPVNIDNEVDRYIGWPGQALGYMMGRLEIRRLRDRTEAELGDRFDLRDFHATVLRHGALPLSILDEVIARWSAGRAG